MNFSDRMGITKPKSIIQIDSMDIDLRSSLWNVYYTFFFDQFSKGSKSGVKFYPIHSYAVSLWADFFKRPIDGMPYGKDDFMGYIRSKFFSFEWYEVYNFMEFSGRYLSGVVKKKFYDSTNIYLQTEMSGFRFINELISPITNESEICEIEGALNQTSGGLNGVNTHLKESLLKLSDKKNPDYRNSIKESISAVESLAQVITSDKKASLGEALTKMKDKIGMHKALEEGYKKIYGYASDGDGIRHSLLEKSNLDFEDAKYMLVSCSAFVNYLIVKAEKAGMKIQ